MKLDGKSGTKSLPSCTGTLCSLFLLIILINYTILKVDVLLQKKDVDILSTINLNFFTQDDVFDYEKGFNIAIGLTHYDSNQEPVDDDSYGEIVFNHYSWGPQNQELGIPSGR